MRVDWCWRHYQLPLDIKLPNTCETFRASPPLGRKYALEKAFEGSKHAIIFFNTTLFHCNLLPGSSYQKYVRKFPVSLNDMAETWISFTWQEIEAPRVSGTWLLRFLVGHAFVTLNGSIFNLAMILFVVCVWFVASMHNKTSSIITSRFFIAMFLVIVFHCSPMLLITFLVLFSMDAWRVQSRAGTHATSPWWWRWCRTKLGIGISVYKSWKTLLSIRGGSRHGKSTNIERLRCIIAWSLIVFVMSQSMSQIYSEDAIAYNIFFDDHEGVFSARQLFCPESRCVWVCRTFIASEVHICATNIFLWFVGRCHGWILPNKWKYGYEVREEILFGNHG